MDQGRYPDRFARYVFGAIRVATLMLRNVAKDPPLTEEPEMLQMSLLRLVFTVVQEAD